MSIAKATPNPVPDFRLDGRTALVTGAGRGLGVGMAKGLAQAGAQVVLMSRTGSELDAVAAEIAAAGDTRAPGATHECCRERRPAFEPRVSFLRASFE